MGMMCPADEASHKGYEEIQTDADDSGSYGQYSYSRYSLTISATKWLQSRATVEPQQGHDTAIYRGRPQFLLVCSHNPVQSSAKTQ